MKEIHLKPGSIVKIGGIPFEVVQATVRGNKSNIVQLSEQPQDKTDSGDKQEEK